MYTVGPWSDEQHSALLAQPLEIGADSDIAGGKVTKVSAWIGSGYTATPDTDQANPLVVAARITDERRKHNS